MRFLRDGALAGVLELDYRVPDACEIVYFGVIREAQGRGFGNHLMRFALHRAWHRPIERVWLHTCTLDDPFAIPFYRRNGFVPYKRQFDIFDDPRVIGMLPADIAPGVPLL
jgi:ribosomal protein S18 acetylase RimI-like enzyme